MRGLKAATTTIQLDDGTLQCKKCGRILGRLEDGVLMVGNIQIWNEARFSCVACGKVYLYSEDVVNRQPNDEAVAS
jgi:uncharacterized protein with PIN domain